MRVVLKGRNLDITPQLRQLITRKIAKLERMLGESAVSAQIVLTLEKYRHITDITVHARGDHMLHGMGDASEWPPSVTQAIEKISQQAQKLKDKWQHRKGRSKVGRAVVRGEAAPGDLGFDADAAESRSLKIIRASRYPVKPMSIEDAALKMGSNDEAFLVFRNAATETINILYRRKDGHLGLIEPEP